MKYNMWRKPDECYPEGTYLQKDAQGCCLLPGVKEDKFKQKELIEFYKKNR